MARRPRDKNRNIRPLVVMLRRKAGAVLSFLLFHPACHPDGCLVFDPSQGVRTCALLLLLPYLCLALLSGAGRAQTLQGFPDQWSTNSGGFSSGFDAPVQQSQFSPGPGQPSHLDNAPTHDRSMDTGVHTKIDGPGQNAASGRFLSQRSSTLGEANGGKESTGGGDSALRISRRDTATRGPASTGSPFQRFTPWVTTIGALAMVVGVFLVFVWMLRRINPQAHQVLPREVVEVLGHTSLSARQRLCLIRLGRKVVLVAMSTESVEPIAEIDDPVEVDRLVGLCVSQRPHSSTQAFRHLFNNYVNGHEIVET
ncbi:MAG: hypothetical protein KatS3mg112_1044 [Thermogutta sp.]|nr:MAG: hypothetical protein KatS3mg112_1044 [Thermogutta sp.]